MAECIGEATATAIDELLFDWLAETGTPGASLIVTDEKNERYATAVGARDREEALPATPETLYGYASVTKSFTALAVLQQVDAGKLALDDPIGDHTDIAFGGCDEITIEALLTHTSGLPSLATSIVLLARHSDLGETGIPLTTRNDLAQYLADAGAERDEHTTDRFLYNNTAYNLLEFAVESATGDPFTEYVAAEILAPLGMSRSTFVPDAAMADENHATPYKRGEDGFESTQFPARELAYGAGGLISSPREMGAYLRYHLTGTTDAGEELVSAQLLAGAHRAQVDPLPRYGDGYGFGWARRELAGRTIVGHGGSLLTSASAIGFVPEEGIGVALATAGQPELHPTEVLEGVVALLLDEDPLAHQPTLAYRDRVTAITGEYTGYRGVTGATVTDEDGHLDVTLDLGPIERAVTLVPTDPSLETYQFESTSAGRPVPASFVETTEGYDFLYDRYRFHKCG